MSSPFCHSCTRVIMPCFSTPHPHPPTSQGKIIIFTPMHLLHKAHYTLSCLKKEKKKKKVHEYFHSSFSLTQGTKYRVPPVHSENVNNDINTFTLMSLFHKAHFVVTPPSTQKVIICSPLGPSTIRNNIVLSPHASLPPSPLVVVLHHFRLYVPQA